MYSLFIDDERFPPDHNSDWIIVRTYEAGVEAVKKYGSPSFVSFDHDLGDGKTGYDFAKFLVDSDIDNSYIMPEDFNFYVHSQNPIGKKNIEELLNSYLRFKRNLRR